MEISKKLGEAGYSIEWVKMSYEEIQADETSEISLDSATKLADKISGTFFLEDTGLYIDSLQGFPGPYSSFIARKLGNNGILKLLEGKDREARFVTVITLVQDRQFHQFEGVLEGTISSEQRGTGGFGFDPIFVPLGEYKTLAEMSTEEKNRLSHRSRALELLISYLFRVKP